MSWEPLQPGVYRGTDQPTISIQKSGGVTWNLAAHRALEEPDQVEILIDHQQGLLAVRKAVSGESGFRVRKLGPQNTWIASARGALRRVGLLPTTAYRRVAQQEDGMLVIDVSDLLKASRKAG
ncbi:MAG: hypothetical protein HPY83_08705 [Anaerolineae bacterium]|nr:hypothetical protein [Anaerolineae bacterium]